MPSDAKRVEVSVFVVDDDEQILRCMPRFFQKLPVRLRCARSAAEALVQIEAEPPDLLISDLHMPDMDGLALIEKVRARWPNVRAVLNTSDGGVLAKAKARGITVVLKLDGMQAFPALVADVLAQRRL
jgi:CheY-like chemotaxis protein